MEVKTLLEEEDLQLRKLEELVRQSIVEEQLLTTRLMELDGDPKLTFSQRLSDQLSSFGGSWSFIVIFFSVIAAWILINIRFLVAAPFDPYPFILLNLILSCVAAVQAPIIMMSQNRQDEKDRQRARGDYLINMKSEMEVRSLHAKVDLLLTEQMKSLFKTQVAQMEYLEKIETVLKQIQRQLEGQGRP
ncbi:MAG: DUF1003 domain-containing protein [Bdellovibrionales bacterium]